MVSVGVIVGGAFRLVRERLGSVMVWGSVYSLGAFALGYFMLSSMRPMVAGTGEPRDPSVGLAAMGSIFGRLLLAYLAFFCFYTILVTAAQRAVLRPDESGVAFIRFGRDELRMIGLAIFLGFLFTVGYVLVFAVVGVIVAATGAVSDASGGMGLAMMNLPLVTLCLGLF
jgi:hypothetical protein